MRTTLTRVIGAFALIAGGVWACLTVQWVLICELQLGYSASLYPPSWTSSYPIPQFITLSFSLMFVGHYLFVLDGTRTLVFSTMALVFIVCVEWVGTTCPRGYCPFGRYEWL